MSPNANKRKTLYFSKPNLVMSMLHRSTVIPPRGIKFKKVVFISHNKKNEISSFRTAVQKLSNYFGFLKLRFSRHIIIFFFADVTSDVRSLFDHYLIFARIFNNFIAFNHFGDMSLDMRSVCGLQLH